MAEPNLGVSFVVLPPLTKHGVVFGKNSSGVRDDFEELVFSKAETPQGLIQTTYIEVESDGPQKALMLSKNSKSWGGEMGANECGVVIGNQPIWSQKKDAISEQKLTGLDLSRLGLSYGSSALEALEIIVKHLEKYGQGGESKNNLVYNNSYLIADPNCAWILETVGPHWAAEEITNGFRCVSNIFTIETKLDKCSDGLKEFAKSENLWDGVEEFNFSKIFNQSETNGSKFYNTARALLATETETKEFRERDMFALLRKEELHSNEEFPTLSSQVSTLSSTRPSVHWFTATKDPRKSVFKPFIFTPDVLTSGHTLSKTKNVPPLLYTLHQSSINKGEVQSLLRSMEKECVEELGDVIESVGADLAEFNELLKDCVETEVKFYR